eukprot:CAMPEP_0119561294 /NCGR_PEP_ID=MMETSP1352-20130426/17194_1 /TAXON_ID=265584 /ORGANISM="Stauroneis constricta, Strain CCMP1120" /LENGTH=627 /DNA_ID=CAMNT_0007609467 /DNA_START=87 /DNA_END=1970 /DNA_ORIENTATION=-
MVRMLVAFAAGAARFTHHAMAFSPSCSVRFHSKSLQSRRMAQPAMGGFQRTWMASPSDHRRLSRSSSTFRLEAASANSAKISMPKNSSSQVPITLLAGFLGSGKTTTLQHLLDNTEGIKIGIIVNDVASVNIDAKLVSAGSSASNLNSPGGVVEMQNGCACCTLAEELLTSVEKVLSARSTDDPLDAVVVELSGVADPVAIQQNWKDATMAGKPVTTKAKVAQTVTIIDSCTFGTDWMSWDIAGERFGWVEEGDECSGKRKVPELLAEQVEAANVVLMNKIDIAGEDQTKIATALAAQLNKKAKIEHASFGKISPKLLLQSLEEAAAPKKSSCCSSSGCSKKKSHNDKHNEPSSASTSESTCTDADRTDELQSHAHTHQHEESSSASTSEPTSTDADFTDESHSHSHTHSHATSIDNLGITNFVYKATRPFNQRKLLTVLNEWPVPIKDDLDISMLNDSSDSEYEAGWRDAFKGNPFVGVLRSKGFCWFAPTRWMGAKEDVWRHDTAMYWSHAGKQFGISTAGKWWHTISKDRMKLYFANDEDEYHRILSEDFVSDEFGDRRQEVVFIGVNIDEEKIRSVLDACLVSEKGMNRYRQELNNWKAHMMARPSSRPSLFQVGAVDHMDVN